MFYLDKVLEVYKWDPVKGWEFLGSPAYGETYFSDSFRVFWKSREWEDLDYHVWVTERSAFSHARVILMWLKTFNWTTRHEMYTCKVQPILEIDSLTTETLHEIFSQSLPLNSFSYAREARIGKAR